MPSFANGKNILLRKPEPGRPINKEKPNQIKDDEIDNIADKIIQAIGRKIPNIQVSSKDLEVHEDFNSTTSMDQLAKAMIIDRDKKESNVENFGIIRETKKNKESTNKTIDLLSNLGD